MSDHKIELVKPIPGSDGPRGPRLIRADRTEDFDRGERIILVDGERWGRTHVRGRGCHGTLTSFSQEYGGEIGHTSRHGHFHAETIASAGKRPWHLKDGEPWPTTAAKTLTKVAELVAAGKLRPPSVVKAEANEAAERYRQHVAQAAEKEAHAFRLKACEALGINNIDEPSDVVDRVVAAMRWAQQQ